MVLIGYTWGDVVVGMLWVSLILLVIVISYRKLLGVLGKGAVTQEGYCVLYNLEVEPASGELPFYFTAEEVKEYSLLILDEDMKEFMEIANQECKIGGNIIRFDSKKLPNGNYFYCLKTDKQKTMKKMVVANT